MLISPIVAPERSNARVTACLSARVNPGAGSASSAEPPPEARNTSWSSGPRPSRQIEDAPRRALAGLVRHRVARLEDLDPLARVARGRSGSARRLRADPATCSRRREPSPPRPCRRRRAPCGRNRRAGYDRRARARVRRGERRVEHGSAGIRPAAIDRAAPRHSSVLPSRRHFISSAGERPALDRRCRRRGVQSSSVGSRKSASVRLSSAAGARCGRRLLTWLLVAAPPSRADPRRRRHAIGIDAILGDFRPACRPAGRGRGQHLDDPGQHRRRAAKGATEGQPANPGSQLDEFFRDFFGDRGAPAGRTAWRRRSPRSDRVYHRPVRADRHQQPRDRQRRADHASPCPTTRRWRRMSSAATR